MHRLNVFARHVNMHVGLNRDNMGSMHSLNST
jgi:hypothetical protein